MTREVTNTQKCRVDHIVTHLLGLTIQAQYSTIPTQLGKPLKEVYEKVYKENTDNFLEQLQSIVERLVARYGIDTDRISKAIVRWAQLALSMSQSSVVLH